MPTPSEIDVIAPTDAHNGSGAVWQKDVKSPKAMLLSLRSDNAVRLDAAR